MSEKTDPLAQEKDQLITSAASNPVPRRGLFVRVGIDVSYGRWNAPVQLITEDLAGGPSNAAVSRGEFVYVPIPETQRPRPGLRRPYQELKTRLKQFGTPLPKHLSRAAMHLDPDFAELSYGDQGRKGQRIAQLQRDDLIVFYAGLRDYQNPARELVYAIIGLYVVDHIIPAHQVAAADYHRNAHTRCQPGSDASDVIVHARPEFSGRLQHCLNIGSRRLARTQIGGEPVVSTKRPAPMYRVLPELLEAWGGMSNNDGYLQRSAVPPELLDVARFYRWFQAQGVALVAEN